MILTFFVGALLLTASALQGARRRKFSRASKLELKGAIITFWVPPAFVTLLFVMGLDIPPLTGEGLCFLAAVAAGIALTAGSSRRLPSQFRYLEDTWLASLLWVGAAWLALLA